MYSAIKIMNLRTSNSSKTLATYQQQVFNPTDMIRDCYFY